MPLASMTGFGRATGIAGSSAWVWELRSVNARGLELRFRLPPGHEGLEPDLRAMVQARLTRGTLHASLDLRDTRPAGLVTLNRSLLLALWREAVEVAREAGAPPPSLDALLGARGVIDAGAASESDEARERIGGVLREGFAAALDSLLRARADEGGKLATVLRARVAEIERLAAEAEASPGRRPEAIRARLARQVADLLEGGAPLDPQRLHQEAALLAVKADVREEIDRLVAHVAQARALLAEGGAVGRKLDFLAQEFGREANTLGAKANDADLSRIGLALKVVVEQFREQVQNVQ